MAATSTKIPIHQSRLFMAAPDGVSLAHVVSLRSFIDDGGARLKQLLAQLQAEGACPIVASRRTVTETATLVRPNDNRR